MPRSWPARPTDCRSAGRPCENDTHRSVGLIGEKPTILGAPAGAVGWNGGLGARPWRITALKGSGIACECLRLTIRAVCRRSGAADHPSDCDQNRRAPNGLAFSCRERAGRSLQNANDRAREAVCCNAVLGGCTRMIPLSNRENNCCTVQNDARVWVRGEAGAQQARG